MRDVVPILTLLVPGPFRSEEELARALREAGLSLPIVVDDANLSLGEVGLRIVEDASLVAAFRHGIEIDDDALGRIAEAGRAAVVDIALPLVERPDDVARVVRALRAAGGLALRMEGSGGAWGFDAWLDCVDGGEPDGLHEASVTFVQDGGTIFSCGMHQLGLPDAEIAMSDPRAAVGWLRTFQLFQLIERPLLASGHTFQPDAESPRRILERWPDARHREGDGRRNPFGLFRFLPEGAPPRNVVEPLPVIIPPLVAILMAAERDKGSPLERQEVDAIVEKSPAMAIKLAHALELERRRGYADLDPEHAYEQWCIVRAMQ